MDLHRHPPLATVALTASVALLGALATAPATASESVRGADVITNRVGGLNTNVKPGRFGKLKLPVSLNKARAKGYLYRNTTCNRWEVRGAQTTRIKKKRVVALEVTGLVTTKGLVAGDSAAKMRALYPDSRINGSQVSQGGSTTWDIYSTKTRARWLDNYVPTTAGGYGLLAVRAESVKRPIYLAGEGC